jgi:hypothetical protein
MIPDRLLLPVAVSIVLHAAAFLSIRRAEAPRPDELPHDPAPTATPWNLIPPPDDPPLVDLAAAEKPAGTSATPNLPETPALSSSPSAIAMSVANESCQPSPQFTTTLPGPTVPGVGIGPGGPGVTISSRLLDNPPRTRSHVRRPIPTPPVTTESADTSWPSSPSMRTVG